MKTAAAAAAASKSTVDEDEDEPKKIRSSRSKRRHARRSSTQSESPSPPRRRSKKSSKRTADRKSKKGKVSGGSSRRRRRSPSPSLSSTSSSPSSVPRSRSSTCSSSSSSERSLSPPPPRSSRSSRDAKKRKGRGRERERDLKRRKARRSTNSSGTSSSGGSSRSRSRSKSSKRSTRDGTTRHKAEKDYDNRRASLSEKNDADYFDRDEEALVASNKGKDYEIEGYEKNASLEDKVENPPSKSGNETGDISPAAAGGSPVAEDLELILRQKALDNFRKFRAAAAAMAGKTGNGAARKGTLTDSQQNGGRRVTEAGAAAITPSRRQASSLGATHPTESPKLEDSGNVSSPLTYKSGAGMSHGAGSPCGILKDGGTAGPTQQEESIIEATHSTSQLRTPLDGRNSRSVMQRLVNAPGSTSVNQRLGSATGVSHVNGAPRIKSVVSIPAREGLDGSTTPQKSRENSVHVESSSEIRHALIDMNKAEGPNGDGRKTSEASASKSSIFSSVGGKGQATEARIEDKDGSQFQKKTFSRMHDGEAVEVSYKVYIPKKTPALARRKLQR